MATVREWSHGGDLWFGGEPPGDMTNVIWRVRETDTNKTALIILAPEAPQERLMIYWFNYPSEVIDFVEKRNLARSDIASIGCQGHDWFIWCWTRV